MKKFNEGYDNYGNPKQAYLTKLSEMSDDSLESECYRMIYQSALCANNHKADWHWMVGACYDESNRREGDIYKKAYEECFNDHAE